MKIFIKLINIKGYTTPNISLDNLNQFDLLANENIILENNLFVRGESL